MKHLLILISILLLTSPLFGQSERPETIIIPVSSLGDVSDTRKLILENTLTDELKKHFRIVPQEKFEQVLEQVFEELEYEECSEDTCIMRVQEMLQVENVFNLQVIGEGKDTQLNLKWITLDEKKNETELCSGCGTVVLNGIVKGLVGRLVEGKTVESVVYKEEIKNSEPIVQRTINYSDGGKYVGGMKYDKKHGQGTLTSPDGDKYVGEFRNGERHGQGTFSLSGSIIYEGKWKNGKFYGKGTFTFSNGNKAVGEFRDNKPWNITTYDKDGKYKWKYVKGVRVK
jgi:hypothetical protein